MRLSNERMENNNMLLTWAPIGVSLIALFFAYKANNINQESAKENFRNILIDKLKNAKYIILRLEVKEYEHQEKMLLVESVSDHLLYQQSTKGKEKYLNKDEQNNLSILQEEVEDYVGLLLLGTDSAVNRNLAINAIKEYLKKL